MFQTIDYLKARLGLLGRDERGVVTIEYALLLVAIVAVVGVITGLLTGKLTELFNKIV